MPTVSVIIPTYRRSRTLPAALASVARQTLPDYEVVVVDNAADAGVEAVVWEAAATARVPVHYVPEPRLGLHHARHAGARAACADVLVYTDDDATFDPGWLAAYADAFDAHPDMAAAGGPLRPVWEAPPPEWLLDYINHDVTSLPLLSLMEPYGAFRLEADGFFYGANMAVRRPVLFDLGGFNPELFGPDVLGDGETGLNLKLWAAGHLVGYVPGAVVHHHVPPTRMTPAYVRRRLADQAVCDLYTRFQRDGLPSRPALLTEAARRLARGAKFVAAAPFLGEKTDGRSLFIRVRAAEVLAQARYLCRLATNARARSFVAPREWLTHASSTDA